MPTLIKENSSNSELVMELIGILQNEASLFETFLELLDKQQQALIKNDIAKLNKVTEEQNLRLADSAELSRKREMISAQLARQDGIDGDVTISKLIESVSSDKAQRLEILKREILDLDKKINKTQSQNEMLIERSRENINTTLELIGSMRAPDGRYHKEGKVKNNSGSLALDRRA